MPSSYSASARYTLQATGENNNTWGVILNNGVFQLVDDNVNGRLAFVLAGAKVLTTALGATDEARMAFLDVTGGTGGVITVPSVSQGHFVRNASAGDVLVSASGAGFTFGPGDIGPVFSDGAAVYGLTMGGKPLKAFITDADQAIIDYIAIAISNGSVALPPATGNLGKALIVRMTGAPPTEVWVASAIGLADLPAGIPGTTQPNTWSALQTFNGSALAPAIRIVNAAEPCAAIGVGVGGVLNFDASAQSIEFFYATPTANFTLNFRGSPSQSLANFLVVGDFMTFTVIIAQGVTVFTLSALQIDGAAVTPFWQGGAQPTPQANSYSVYTFAVRHAASGASWNVFASMTRFV